MFDNIAARLLWRAGWGLIEAAVRINKGFLGMALPREWRAVLKEEQPMALREKIIRAVQKKADTAGTKINAAEVSRVASLTLDELIDALKRQKQKKE